MKRKYKLILSFIIAVGVSILSYCISNLDFAISGEGGLISNYESLRTIIGNREQENNNDSIVMIDVSYDRQLTDVKDEYGLPAGQTDITDRKKLIRILDYLHHRNRYKYRLCDIFLDEAYSTPEDSQLISVILSMDRIAIPRHSDLSLIDSRLNTKAGYADYFTIMKKNGIVKYPYLNKESSSLPLKMYEEITGHKVRKKGIAYTDNGKLARSSIILNYDFISKYPYDNEGRKNWLNLGTDVLGTDSLNGEDGLLKLDPEFADYKYVLIGSFRQNDIHNTIKGKMPGTIVLFNAYLSLLNRHHIISWLFIIFMFIVYAMMAYYSLNKVQAIKWISQYTLQLEKKGGYIKMIINWLLSWLGYSLLMSVICLITYIFFDETYDIFITSTLFAIIGKIIDIYFTKGND